MRLLLILLLVLLLVLIILVVIEFFFIALFVGDALQFDRIRARYADCTTAFIASELVALIELLFVVVQISVAEWADYHYVSSLNGF